jgi:hypothetical protein
MTIDGTSLWVLDIDFSPNVFRYNMSGVYQNNSFTLDAENSHAEGITWDGQYFWVVDQQADKVLQVQHRRGAPSLLQRCTRDGIPSDGTSLWVVDTGTEKMYEVLA